MKVYHIIISYLAASTHTFAQKQNKKMALDIDKGYTSPSKKSNKPPDAGPCCRCDGYTKDLTIKGFQGGKKFWERCLSLI